MQQKLFIVNQRNVSLLIDAGLPDNNNVGITARFLTTVVRLIPKLTSSKNKIFRFISCTEIYSFVSTT